MADTKETANRQRLIGWLVSYADENLGKSYELRAGRTLVSSHAENGNACIQVAERDISAPHSALNASTSHKILVQDIFTEKGTYLRRAGSGKEERLQGAHELQHGDWIRFGDKSRFQVCLIDNPSA